MTVIWDVSAPGMFDSEALVCPARYNFPQAAIYRLKMSNLPAAGRGTVSDAGSWADDAPDRGILGHNAIPVQFTPEDFDQVLSGNFVTKSSICPIPSSRIGAGRRGDAVSTRLDPGVDRSSRPTVAERFCDRAAGQQGPASPGGECRRRR